MVSQYNENTKKEAIHINGYLLNAPDIWLENRSNKSKNNFSKITTGSPPTDDGGLLMTFEEKEELIKKYPNIYNGLVLKITVIYMICLFSKKETLAW